MLTTTAAAGEREDLVSQALCEMPAAKRERLERYALSEGITPEAAIVQIVARELQAEGR